MTKPGSSYCKLPLKETEEDEEDTQEAATSLTAAEDASMGVAVVAVNVGDFHMKRKRKSDAEGLSWLTKFFLLHSLAVLVLV